MVEKSPPSSWPSPPGEGIVVSAFGQSERLTFASGSGVQCANLSGNSHPDLLKVNEEAGS